MSRFSDEHDANKDLTSTTTAAPHFDAKEYIGVSEEDLVDYDTAEELLLHFSRTGKLPFVDKLLSLREAKEIPLNIDCKGESKANFGWTPLHLAAYFGHKDVAHLLLNHGADADIQNEEGDTPLHKAAYTGRDEIVVLLVGHNANVFIVNGDGLRPFEVAKSESIRAILITAEKADIKRREGRFLSAARAGDLNTLKKLLEDATSPVDINCVDQSGNSALHCASYRGKHEAVVFLLKNGIDTMIKNKRDQLAANVASTVSLKQLIQEVHLSVMTPQMIASMKSRAVSRFEGPLLKKGRFFGWKLIWAVLERGVFSFFSNRADATTGVRRKGYRYLESAITERVNGSPEAEMNMFMIIFGDRSRALFSLPKSQTELDCQKWINAIQDHIYFGTNFMKQGTRITDSDDEDETANQLLPLSSVHDMIITASAHQKILEKHIAGLQHLLDDETLFSADDVLLVDNASIRSVNSGVNSISNSTIPSIKFHLNLILESSRNANSSLVQCLTVVSHQNEARQTLIRQEQEKVRVLEEALQVLAREHHDLERSIIGNSISMNVNNNNNNNHHNSHCESFHVNGCSMMLSPQQEQNTGAATAFPPMPPLSFSRSRSLAGLSDTTATDMDEYFDAFDDEEENVMENISDRTLGGGGGGQHETGGGGGGAVSAIDGCRSPTAAAGHLSFSPEPSEQLNAALPAALKHSSTGTFHTARDKTYTATANDEVTINDSISTLSSDEDRTLASIEMSFSRDRLPAMMVPRDEVGLWSILKHCMGKDLSKITIPVVFNEPLSFLQRMAEIFEYCNYLNIADQCDDVVERMENVCAFIISSYSSNYLRLNKPFNPLLGETFEFEVPSAQTKIVLEQVSHHPPISAWHAESPHFVMRGSINPRLRFWGKSIEVKPEGSLMLTLKRSEETYTWKSVNCCVHNIIVGKLWFEQYGDVEVINHSNKYRISLNFKSASWFSGYELNRFDGFILNERKERVRFLYGKWNDYLKSASAADYEEYLKANKNQFRVPEEAAVAGSEHHENFATAGSRKVISKLGSLTKQLTGGGGGGGDDKAQEALSTPEQPRTEQHQQTEETETETAGGPESSLPKSDSSHSLDISNSRILWKVQPRPEHSPAYYHFNSFAFSLNELPSDTSLVDTYPITDSRFRPDIRKLEEGDLDGAAAEKHRLEEKQRETRKLLKKRKEKEPEPLWFGKQVSPLTKEEEWTFNQKYWSRDWSRCPDIF